MNVILLRNNHQHVSAHSCGHLQGGEKKNTITVIMSGWISTNYYCNRILVLTTLQMGTTVAEICGWLPCNKIAFIHSSSFVELIKIFCVPLRPDIPHVAVCFYPQCPAQNTDGIFNTYLCLFLSN